MHSTFTIPNGSVSRWTPAVQLQSVVQPADTAHSTQIPPAVQPTQTQLMVVNPSDQVQYKLHMNQAGWRNQQLNTAQMTMACPTWKSDEKARTEGDWYRWQQENVRLHQQYQLLHSEYQSALVQIQTLAIQQTELDKKLKVHQWKYQELNNKYMIGMQLEKNRYNSLSNIHNETCIQFRNEQGKCNALSIELEESVKNFKNEQRKYKVLSAIHAETKKTLKSVRQKRNEVVNVIDSKNKSESEKRYEAVDPISSRDWPVKPRPKKPPLEHGSQSNTIDSVQTAGANASCERNNYLVVPPGFE